MKHILLRKTLGQTLQTLHSSVPSSSTRSSHIILSHAIFCVAASLVLSSALLQSAFAEQAATAVASTTSVTTSNTKTPQLSTSQLSTPQPATHSTATQNAINILLVPIDEASAKAVSDTRETPSAAPNATSNATSTVATSTSPAPTESFSPSVSVGSAERAAAPLRRALLRSGYGDVLTAAPHSSVLRRAVEEGRLPQSVVDDLSGAMRLVSSLQTSDETPPLPASSTRSETEKTAETASQNNDVAPPATSPAAQPATPPITPPITMSVVRSASVSGVSEVTTARRKAIEAASRIGRLLDYRAVVAFSVTSDADKPRIVFLLVDSLRESGAVIAPAITTSVSGGRAFSLAAAEAGSALLGNRLETWDAVTTTDKTRLAENGIVRARALFAAGEAKAARDEINTALALDPTRTDVYDLLGDILLQSGDATGAVAAYRRVLDATPAEAKAPIWAKIAQAYVASKNWPETLSAGEQALAQNADSADLRLAMGQAQIGRAQLFQAANRGESATYALEEAEKHLTRAASLSPDDSRVMRLQVQQLTLQGRGREALSLLDRVAVQYPNDGELQANYATILLGRTGREADAFRAWTRAWTSLSKGGTSPANEQLIKLLPAPERLRFRRLSEGFDLSIGAATKNIYNLTERVLEGNLSREDAIAQSRAPMNFVLLAGQAMKNLNVPDDRLRDAHLARLEAADKMTQAVAAYSLFLENGDENFRDSATELHKAAVAQINAQRAAQ